MRKQYHPKEEKVKKSLAQIFKLKPIAESTRSYEQLWIQVAMWITDFVLEDAENNIERIKLFLDILYLEMTSNAYLNSQSDFNNAYKLYQKNWHIITKSWYWTCIHTKEDFLS